MTVDKRSHSLLLSAHPFEWGAGKEGMALVTNWGHILTLPEVLQLLTDIKPFYDDVKDSTIIEYNTQQEQLDITRSNTLYEYGGANKQPPRPQKGYIYVLQSGPYYKIGLSRQVDKRIRTLSTLPPFDLDLVLTIETHDMYSLESALHKHFADKRKNGEWFELDPEDVAWLQQLKENTNGR